MLASIDERDKDYVCRGLKWLLYAERVLTVAEMAEAMAVNPSRKPCIQEEDRITAYDVLNLLSAFVVLLPSQRHLLESFPSGRSDAALADCREKTLSLSRLRLAHFSVKEYLASPEIRRGENSRFALAETDCRFFLSRASLTYTLRYISTSGADSSHSEGSACGFPLLQYAASTWFYYRRETTCVLGDEAEHVTLEWELFRSRYNVTKWCCVWDPSRSRTQHTRETSRIAHAFPSNAPALCYTSYLGCYLITKDLLEREGIPDRKLSSSSSHTYDQNIPPPLCLAAEVGFARIAELILVHGACIDETDENGYTALFIAIERRCVHVLDALLKWGANVNLPCGTHNETALFEAWKGYTYYGSREILLKLIEAGADPNIRIGCSSLLYYAVQLSGNDTYAVDLLLAHGAAVDARSQHQHGPTPLHEAAYCGYAKSTKALIAENADINAVSQRRLSSFECCRVWPQS